MPPDALLLALDVGNTATKGALYAGTERLRAFAVAAPEGLATALGEDRPAVVGIASVAPERSAAYHGWIERELGLVPVPVSADLDLPIAMGYRTPRTLGADRLAAAAAAWDRWGGTGHPVLALDAGTALTLEVIDGLGVYRGGAIAPGPGLLRDALARGTAQLPEVALALPRSSIGASTTEAIQAGLLFPFVDGAAGLLRRAAEALGAEPIVVATGGWATLLADHVPAITHVEPHLVLDGVRLLTAPR